MQQRLSECSEIQIATVNVQDVLQTWNCKMFFLLTLKYNRFVSLIQLNLESEITSLLKLYPLLQYPFRKTLDGLELIFCSEDCFINYHKANNMPVVICDACASMCPKKRLLLRMEQLIKTVCGEECLHKFKEVMRANWNLLLNNKLKLPSFIYVFPYFSFRKWRLLNGVAGARCSIRCQTWWRVKTMKALWSSSAATGV